MRKNILILAHGYGLPFIESCNQYTQFFDETQYDVTVAYLSGKPDDTIIQKTHAKNTIFLNCSLRGLKLGAIYQVYKLCREKKFDVVICHRYKPIYILLWITQLYRIPTVICVLHAMGTMQSVWRRLLMTTLAKKNILFAGVSNAVSNDLRRHLPRIAERIVTLYNIIDYKLFEPQLLSRTEARAQLQLSDEMFVFGHIGRLAYEKDQKTLIEAFADVVSQHANAKLVIIGNGELEARLKKQASDLNIRDNIIFTGFIPNSYRLMKAFDVFVLCSVKESFGRVLLEAMTARIPIIGTHTDGIPEVVADAGFLVAAARPQQLAEVMVTVTQASPKKLAETGEKGYQRMLSHFSIEAVKKFFWQLPLLKEQADES